MLPSTIALLLASAVLHAAWNAVLRSDTDRLASITVMTATGGLIALPFALWLPAPAPEAWPFLALSSTLQVGYCLFLVRAYRDGELGQVYPIARGSSPLLVTVGAAVLANERLGGPTLLGVVLVSSGIVCLALGRVERRSLAAALMTGVFIAGYTVTDGLGSRASGGAGSYVAWLFVLHGAFMLAVYAVLRGRPAIGWRAPLGGVLSLGAYGIVVWALSISPMGATSALRETSVLFAAILGRVFLGERLGLVRIGACVAIAVGVVCLSA